MENPDDLLFVAKHEAAGLKRYTALYERVSASQPKMDPPVNPQKGTQNTQPSQDPQPAAESAPEPNQSGPGTGEGTKREKKPKNKGRDRTGRKNKRKDMGRSDWGRARNTDEQAAKRRKLDNDEKATPIYATQFSAEDIANEERRPKKKAAVLLGYSGSGYHGMQLNNTEKTIEGDLFAAFVAAGAISKANATDPKKSSLVRCARTDKGVHAAGNVVSLKLIIEDPDIVSKINENLNPQIRVWGIKPTNKNFSSYSLCDSRVYEYLLPSHCLLPPHPSTHIGKKIVELAKSADDLEGLTQRQEEVATFWDDTHKRRIQPILDSLDEQTQKLVKKALYIYDESSPEEQSHDDLDGATEMEQSTATLVDDTAEHSESLKQNDTEEGKPKSTEPRISPITAAVKSIRAAYLAEKRAYRIDPARLARLREALSKYLGTKNYYNYTIQKNFADPSAKRIIRSFEVSPDPIIINGTEWLSLKVHGQSFMMHQIRKMVAMAVMVVRCGCDPQRIVDTYGNQRISIPKAPGLGLLLEHPVFSSYNARCLDDYGKEPIDFGEYQQEIDKFKEREIYQRIYKEEEETNGFGNFFNHLDNFNGDDFLYVTSGGIEAAKPSLGPRKATLAKAELAAESEDEVVDGGEEGG